MKLISKGIVLSLFALIGQAHAQDLRCETATKALQEVRSVVIHQTEGKLFGAVGKGVAVVQLYSRGTFRTHRIPVSSYWSKGFFLNIFGEGSSTGNLNFYLHSNDQRDGLVSGDLGYGPLHFPVICRYLN